MKSGGEQGLLSVAFHPRWPAISFLFVNYTDRAGDTVVARYLADGDVVKPRTARVVLRIEQPFDNHNGGQLQFGPDGYLYVGMGDGGAGNDPQCNAQRGGTLLGKMLRIDVDQYRRRGPCTAFRATTRSPAVDRTRRRSGRSDCATRGASRSIARPAISTSPTWDRARARRSTSSRRASAGGENYGWAREEGSLCLERVDACPRIVPPCGDPELASDRSSSTAATTAPAR